MYGFQKSVGRTALFLSLLSTAATGAYAQTVPADTAPGQAATADQAPATLPDDTADAAPAKDIVITGSRISRKDYTADSPILTVNNDALSRSGAPTVEAGLNSLPQFQPSAGAAQSFPPRGGQANINLRGLGTNRALVLMDGRRIVPANPDGTVDVNIIPQQLIQNVETITGGASTAYGSDAMAGVVNFRLRQDFTGLQITGNTGITEKGDAATYDLSGIAGVKLGDRGNITGFVSYSQRDAAYRGDRAFFNKNGSSNLAFIPQGLADLSTTPISQGAVDALFAKYGVAAGTVTGRAFGFNADGSLFTTANNPIANYHGDTSSDIRIQNNSVLYNTGSPYVLQIPLKRLSTYLAGNYDITPDVNLYANVLYTQYKADVQYSVPAIGGMGQTAFIPVTNPFIPGDLRTLLNARGANANANFLFRNSAPEFGPRVQAQDYHIFQSTLGLKGTIPGSKITYDIYGAYGETRNNETFEGGLSFTALNSLLFAPDGGASKCSGGFNPFGENAVSASCIAYLSRSPVNHLKLTQGVIEATVQGPIFDLPAGELRFAAGGTYRRNTYNLQADASLASGDITGYGTFGSGGGHDAVKEAFGELLIPVIHNTPFIEELNLDLAARYSDYDSIGGLATYKADFDWKVAQPIRFRGGYSRAARAPSLGELYGAPATASVQIGNPPVAGDPCDVRGSVRKNAGSNAGAIQALCIAQGVTAAQYPTFQYNNVTVFAINRGNPNLEAEKADTFSFGTVLSSPFKGPVLSHITASIDYYSIKINNAIGTLSLQTSLNRCFSAATNPTFSPTNFYCQQLPRQPGGFLATATQPLLNQAGFKTTGIDGQVDWRIDMADLGVSNTQLDLNFAGTYVDSFKVQELPGAPILDYSGTTGPVSSAPVYPKFKSTMTTTVKVGPVSLSGKWRHISSVIDFSQVTNPASTVQGVPTYDYFDADLRFDVGKNFQLTFGMINIGDRQPSQVGTAFGNTDFATYDVLGRRFYAGFRAKF
jgi:outer membrane receptor protein involved in Fe transport